MSTITERTTGKPLSALVWDGADMKTPPLDRGCVAIIPARGGSKGIQRKNITPLNGKPLIAYTIEVAQKVRGIDRVIVSTEDTEIAETAMSLGAEVPFLRPKTLADDSSIITEALLDVRNRLLQQGYCVDHQVVMYPTHPFRRVQDVELLVNKLLEGYKTVLSVKKVVPAKSGFLYFDKKGSLQPLHDIGNAYPERTYCRGYGYFHGANFNAPQRSHYIKALPDGPALVDIDTPADLKLAEAILKNNLFEF